MSISDFSLSSPRKGAGKGGADRSMTYDEDFENFLNDTSESELTSNRYKKQGKPWWMKEEEDEENRGSKTNKSLNSTAKSFIKQPKPQAKLATTYESNEINEERQYSEDFDEQIPKLSLDHNSTLSELQNVLISRESRKKSYERYDEDNKYDDYYEESSEHVSSSRKSQPSVIQRKSEDILKTQATQNQTTNGPGASNLLSKVMFMDSLETGAAGNQTINHAIMNNLMDAENRKYLQNLETNTINQDAINNLIDPANRKYFENVEANKNNSRMNTETRRDLQDLEMVYRNLATFPDTGLNTFNNTRDVRDEPKNQDDEEDHYDEEDEQEPNRFNKSIESLIGEQAIDAIKNELENRVLEQVLRDMNVKNRNLSINNGTRKREMFSEENERVGADWPPGKYKHIKGTGYGTSWKPRTVRSSLNQHEMNLTYNRPRPKSANKDSGSSKRLNGNYSTKNDLSMNHFDEYRNYEQISNLQDQLIMCAEDSERKIKEIRSENEKHISELKSKIINLTTQLNEKNSQTSKKVSFDSNNDNENDNSKTIKDLQERISQLEKSLSEQERLMHGYQLENERLYNEMKSLKETKKKEISRIEEEKKHLKLNLIQERLSFEKELKHQQSSQVQKINLPEAITQETFNDSNKDLESALRLLGEENKILKTKLIFYEKNQHQIESDVKVIEAKNKQIKALNDKLKFLEMGKAAPECLREIKRLKNQLKEMDLLTKRLKRPVQHLDPGSNPDAINLSLDYYEKRIEQLEAQLKEKILDCERTDRMWNQKLNFFNQINHEEPTSINNFDSINKKLIEIENKNLFKINDLQNLNSNLRKMLEDSEFHVKEKQNEIDTLRIQLKNYETKSEIIAINQSRQIKKSYEPNEFMDRFIEPEITSTIGHGFDSEFIRNLFSEVESVKVKLAKAQGELKLVEKSHELKIEQIRNSYEKKLSDSNRKHKYEVEKLLSVLTGSFDDSKSVNFADSGYDGESVLDDPIRLRLLIETRDKNKTYQAKFERLIEANKSLNEKLNELKYFKQRCEVLEEENGDLRQRIGVIEIDLQKAKQNFTPQMRDFDSLNEKLRSIEKKYNQREKEMQSLLGGNAPSLTNMNSSKSGETLFSVQNEAKINEMVNYYECQLKIKNKEIEKFKNELDTMLKLLQSLQ